MVKTAFIYFFLSITCTLALAQVNRPNVIIILTDDQGIGDLACHGNPWIKTPNLDAFYQNAVRMTDFHVSPLCTPTRAALMTGRYPINTGTWATFKGRDALPERLPTMAEIFQQNGYRTGLFGKWHLGDNYPLRPTDRGFDLAIHHKSGGVGELSDYWGNSYFNDVYFVNNEAQQFEGYCTDIWFREAMNFMDTPSDQPFFVYLATNAPHDPYIVDESYSSPYKDLEGTKIVNANFYGMISNIDENMGKLEAFLQESGLAENTLVLFLTDNGTSGGVSRDASWGYNYGFRGRKGQKTEGGHRVPCFFRWPKVDIQGGRDIQELTAHIDLLPTFAGLCDLQLPEKMALDGQDFSSLLLQETDTLPGRTLFIHHRQDWRPPLDIDQTCIMQDHWRLLHGKELYKVDQDRDQQQDLATKYPELISELLAENQRFLLTTKASPDYHEIPVFTVGNDKQQEIGLTIQHAIGEDRGIWKVEQVAAGMKNTNNTHPLKIERDGMYLISCQRWPKECPGPVLGVPAKRPEGPFPYHPIQAEKVRIQIANQMLEKHILPEVEAVEFRVSLEKGKTFLVTDFIEGAETYGVYYTYVSYVGSE